MPIAEALDLLDTQMLSRHLDFEARLLKETGDSFYTIGSSGHEGNAAIAKAFACTDMAFLHYRSAAFMIQRAKEYGQSIDKILYDHMLAFVASSEDPIAGGRHKVFGSKVLNVPPQTSTIASHLPKAFGAAFGLVLSKSQNKVVICSFGDASLNHSTAQGTLNAIEWLHHQHIPMPIVLVCEDNGIGISVPTPPDWVATAIKSRPYLRYVFCDGRNIAEVYAAAKLAKQYACAGTPVFLHMQTVRLLGHAGSDIEFHYRTLAEIEAIEAQDPILYTARMCVAAGYLSKEAVIERYEAARILVREAAQKAVMRPKLSTKEAIMASIIPPTKIRSPKQLPQQSSVFEKSCTMQQALNQCLRDLLVQYPEVVLFGEDVGVKGGVYRVTANLQQQFGKKRVFDTLLDEQTILGTAIGMAHLGFIPIPEIQFLAYTHNAADQIRGEAATLSFFSSGQFTNPMVIRIPGLAYQKGFGGHFHNDNALAFLREIPGIILLCPSTPHNAVTLLRRAVHEAYVNQRVVIFIEPIALYMVKDMQMPYPSLEMMAPFLEVQQEGTGDVAIITYGNGAYYARKAISNLLSKGVAAYLVELAWIHPMPLESMLAAVRTAKAILIVDECRKTGSLSEALITALVEANIGIPMARITAEDCFIPLGNAWQSLLPNQETIEAKTLELHQLAIG